MKIAFANPKLPTIGNICVGVTAGPKLTNTARLLDKVLNKTVSRAIKIGSFKGKKGQSITIPAPVGSKFDLVIVIGLGAPKDLDPLALQEIGGKIISTATRVGIQSISVCIDVVRGCKLAASEIATEMAFGARLGSYRFDKYRTIKDESEQAILKTITFCVAEAKKVRREFTMSHEKVADGVAFTRDLVSEPANILYPETLAKEARKLGKLGVKVEVMNKAQLKKLGMGALLGVAQGSVRDPRVVVMQWNGAQKKPGMGKDGPLAFIGKGVTFDTGGISLKPARSMEDMKWDMGGSGVVIGLIKALAGRKAKVNVVGVVGLVENMPDGNAQRPGDIVTSMSGKTIEVLNTDAEGRLVLADILYYCNQRFKPRLMVDLATLTGAIIVSLGDVKAGLFSNSDELSNAILTSGDKVAENVWRMPLEDEYDNLLKSNVADMKNISSGFGAGSITAAQFLQRFVDDTPWAHLDIAGVTWSKKDAPTVPKGGTGFGVRLLNKMVADYYEGK